MTKDVMGAPKRRDALLNELKSQTEAIEGAAPGPSNVQSIQRSQPAELVPDDEEIRAPERRASLPALGGLDLNTIRSMKPTKEARDQAIARYPISLLDDLDLISRLTGMKKQRIMEDALRKEVALLKKRHGLE